MRIDVKKYLFIGNESDRQQFFARAQKAGMIDFIDSNPKQSKEIPDAVPHFAQAIKILRGLPVVEQVETTEYWRASDIVEEIIKLYDQAETYKEEIRTLRLEISRVGPFGDFSLTDISHIETEGNRKVQFYCGKAHALDASLEEDAPIYIASEHGLHYFMGINQELRQYPNMIEMKIDLPLGELKIKLHQTEHKLAIAEQRLKQQARYHTFLKNGLSSILSHHDFQVACTYPKNEIDGRIFAVQGWVPVNKLEVLKKLGQEMSIYADEVAIEPTDRIPTYLENEGAGRIGEDLVKIYDIPSHNDKDPSMWVLGFFALFFAIIVGDAGYGLIYLAIALYLRYKFPHAVGAGKRVINLATILAISCILWGILATSFFSLPVDLNSPLRRASLISWLAEKKADYHVGQQDESFKKWAESYPEVSTAKSGAEFLAKGSETKNQAVIYPILAKFSDSVVVDLILLIGIIHLILSLARYLPRNWAGLGWIIFLIGSYLYFPKYLDANTMAQYLVGIPPQAAESAGLYLIYIGLGLAVVLSLIQNKLFGLLEITNVIQICCDVLSYLRLYALGLAGAMMAATVNELVAPLPFVVAVIVLIFGHVVNMALCIMGGVIHGLRLNFLEWFHYSFHGDGRLFKPLKMQDTPH